MTVQELIAELQTLAPDALVILASDSEGNSHSPLYQCWVGTYRATSTWRGETGLAELTDDDRADGYTELDVIRDGVPAVILCPAS